MLYYFCLFYFEDVAAKYKYKFRAQPSRVQARLESELGLNAQACMAQTHQQQVEATGGDHPQLPTFHSMWNKIKSATCSITGATQPLGGGASLTSMTSSQDDGAFVVKNPKSNPNPKIKRQ